MDSRICRGASVFLKSVDFRAFGINVKTIAPTQKLYQSGHAIWWASIPMPIASFLEEYDFSGKTIIPFCSHGGGRFGQSLTTIAKLVPDAQMGEALSVHYSGGSDLPDEITEWLKTNGIK